MGACGSRPMTLEDDTPMELPAAKKTSVITRTVTPAEASATTEVTVELSKNKEEKTEGKETHLVDLSELKAEESKSEEVESEPIVSPEETKGESKEETLNTESITEEVAKESEEKVAGKAKPTQA